MGKVGRVLLSSRQHEAYIKYSHDTAAQPHSPQPKSESSPDACQLVKGSTEKHRQGVECDSPGAATKQWQLVQHRRQHGQCRSQTRKAMSCRIALTGATREEDELMPGAGAGVGKD